MSAAASQNRGPLAGKFRGYWRQSRRPLASLAFVLPLLAVYEIGVLTLGPSAVRNGADVWLRQLLDLMGLGSYFLLPVLTLAALLAWHHTTRDRWRLSAGVLYGMAVESALLGFVLLALAHAQGSLLQLSGITAPSLSIISRIHVSQFLGTLVGFFGAGIYEEVLFRLLMMPPVGALIGLLGGSPKTRIVGAVVITSLVFSTAHYIGPYGDPLDWFSFVFRFLAGGFFALLFVYRGFGIATGAHALYDILVGVEL